MNIIKRLLCRHEHKTCVTNFYGDMINRISLRKVYRSAWRCEDCGKIIYSEKLEPSCKVVNWDYEWPS